MSAIKNARDHLAGVIAETDALLSRYKEHLVALDAEVAEEAAKVPTWEDVRALVARVPAA